MIEVLIFGLVILSVVCLWILIERRKEPKFLVWFIPALLVLVTSTYFTYTAVLGFPKFANPKYIPKINIPNKKKCSGVAIF